jgi:UDP-N-acetyl-D-glucosamine dehydrogenase
MAACKKKLSVIGFDIDQEKVASINSGRSYLKHISSDGISSVVQAGLFRATADFADIAIVDAIIICVPTPLTAHREPDLTYVERTVECIAPFIRRGHLVVLESTTWPGTTEEIVKPILERKGLKCGDDIYLAFSPEREDPGDQHFTTQAIPKIVGGDDPVSLKLALGLYRSIFKTVVPVSSAKAAEAVKLTENIFRAVNIALVNELKVVFDRMGIDVWEIIEAAKTKPFGYMPFYPGPGLGGHCIPIDPFYLTWKAREYDISTRFVELAGEINTNIPHYVIDRLTQAMDRLSGRGLNGSKILIVGIAYKKNIDDTRESPAFRLIDLLEKRGATTDFYDPFVELIPKTREHPAFAGRLGIKWDLPLFRTYDAAVIVTDHDNVDYRGLCDSVKLVVDTRNACGRAGIVKENVVKA